MVVFRATDIGAIPGWNAKTLFRTEVQRKLLTFVVLLSSLIMSTSWFSSSVWCMFHTNQRSKARSTACSCESILMVFGVIHMTGKPYDLAHYYYIPGPRGRALR